MYLSLSWRNLWRNKRRTIIAAASVFFAVVLAISMRSMEHGSYAYMIYSSAKLFTGYLQIQGKGYWDNRSLDESISINAQQFDSVKAIPHVTSATPRLEAYSLVSYKNSTKVSQVIGIEPRAEDEMTELKSRVVKGQYLQAGSDGVLIGQGLAEVLGVSVGDSIVLYGQGYHGQIAAARLPIDGIVDLPFPEMNNGLVYLTLSNAQDVFSANGRITSLAIMIDDLGRLQNVKNNIRSLFDDRYTIMTWDEMMPDLVQSIQMDNASGLIMISILYMVIAFGVFGTIMMMTAEREKEFGILNSIGMKKHRMIFISLIESIIISLTGVVFGVLGSIPVTAYLKENPIVLSGDSAKLWESLGIEPIMNFSVNPDIYFWQSVIVFVIAIFCAVYPLLFIGHLKPIQAMRR